MKTGFPRLTRIIVSAVVLTILAAGLTWPALMLPVIGPWLAKIQIGTAVMEFSLFIFVLWLLITLIFGRVYCSTVCPVGTLQDIGSRLVRLNRAEAEKRRYSYRPPATKARYIILVVTILLAMAGLTFLPSIVEPFSAFQRVCESFFRPLVQFVARGLHALGISNDGAATVITASVSGSLIALVIFNAVMIISMYRGRLLCNTVCPVGTALGCVSRGAVFQMDIDTDLCIHCGKCEDVCKASCINLTDCTVDGSRCVVCFDCTSVCPNRAIRYTWQRKQLSTPLMQSIGPLGRQPEATLENSGACNIKKNSNDSKPSRS